MPFASEQVYNDLDGESVKQILLIRFADLLNSCPSLQRSMTMPRVQMNLLIRLDMLGLENPIQIKDELLVRMKEPPMGMETAQEQTQVLAAEINSDTTQGGQPPDQIRVEHGLPVLEQRKGPFGNTEDVEVVHPEGIKYAFNITQDYGPARTRTGMEGPVIGGQVIAEKNQARSPEVGPDFSRLRDPNYQDNE